VDKAVGRKSMNSGISGKAGHKLDSRNRHGVSALVALARENLGMTQIEFAELLSVSVRTLEGWELGKKRPSGAVHSLIRIATERPDVLREVLSPMSTAKALTP
jgi:DNA-binding transcriptional regulator YiaG